MVVPKADIAYIGKSSTCSVSFSKGLDVKVRKKGFYETPLGLRLEFKQFELSSTRLLTCKPPGKRHFNGKAELKKLREIAEIIIKRLDGTSDRSCNWQKYLMKTLFKE